VRVLLVCHRFPPDSIAGVERITQSLATELAARGDTVTIVTRRTLPLPSQPRRILERLPDGTRLVRLAGGEISLDRPFLHHERLDSLFAQALVAAEPDVVHFLHLVGLSPRFVETARALCVPVVLELQDFYIACPLVHLQKRSGALCDGPDGGRECASTCFADGDPATLVRWGLRSTYFRSLMGMAQRIVCPSRYVASFFERFGADPGRVSVLPNGITIDSGAPPSEELSTPGRRGTFNVAFIGTVVAHKGVHVILEALRLAGLGSVALTVIGFIADQRYADALRSAAAEVEGLTMRLYGEYEPRILEHLLRDVDCVVAPSLVPEAGPISPREALANGIPVIASRLGALPEIVVDGDNGMTFDHRRPDELAEILRRISEDEPVLQRLRDGARATPLPTFAVRARTLCSLYEKAIAEAGGDAAEPSRLAEADVLRTTLLDSGLALRTAVPA
jgi:glycosyltransferase involved in cell wall biosynthesis